MTSRIEGVGDALHAAPPPPSDGGENPSINENFRLKVYRFFVTSMNTL